PDKRAEFALGRELPADRLDMDDSVEAGNREQLLEERVAEMRDLLDAVARKDDGPFAGSKFRQIGPMVVERPDGERKLRLDVGQQSRDLAPGLGVLQCHISCLAGCAGEPKME